MGLLDYLRGRWVPDAGIHVFCGENGSGKTMVAVERCVVPVLKLGFPVVTNVTIKTEVLGLDRDQYCVKIRTWRDILQAGVVEDSVTGGKPCVIFLDEASALLPARQYQQTPPELLAAADMFRKADALVVITAPNFFKLEKALRGTSQLVTHCTGFRADRWQRGQDLKYVRDEKGRRVPRSGLWPNNLMFLAEDFRPETYELSATMPIEAVAERKWSLLRMVAPLMVDSRERVGMLDHIIDRSLCGDCGREKRKEWCSCGATHKTNGRARVLA